MYQTSYDSQLVLSTVHELGTGGTALSSTAVRDVLHGVARMRSILYNVDMASARISGSDAGRRRAALHIM